ncbi:uncharacterized protein LOC118921892 [Manis pentadactyla]|uniref:uncharacterized protein LOC118921892 n=1 Tax=Manis pentadactyla TaxID=143292 RepID=UPI00255D1552|nr:uncharacterized protein LOC118921892 [Manis pentadactyla]
MAGWLRAKSGRRLCLATRLRGCSRGGAGPRARTAGGADSRSGAAAAAAGEGGLERSPPRPAAQGAGPPRSPASPRQPRPRPVRRASKRASAGPRPRLPPPVGASPPPVRSPRPPGPAGACSGAQESQRHGGADLLVHSSWLISSQRPSEETKTLFHLFSQASYIPFWLLVFNCHLTNSLEENSTAYSEAGSPQEQGTHLSVLCSIQASCRAQPPGDMNDLTEHQRRTGHSEAMVKWEIEVRSSCTLQKATHPHFLAGGMCGCCFLTSDNSVLTPTR